MRKIGLFCAGLCVAAVVSACGGESTTTTEGETDTATPTASPTTTPDTTGPAASPTTAADTTGPAAPSDATISIEDFSYGDPVTVAPGALITVINGDSAEHSVTSRTAGLFDLHVDGNSQQTLTAPMEPGEYPFYCIYHPSMTGTLTVK